MLKKILSCGILVILIGGIGTASAGVAEKMSGGTTVIIINR